MLAVGMLTATALLFLLYALIVGILRGRFFAYGGESVIWNLTHKLRVSTLPNKQSSLVRKWYSPSFALRHSRFYSDENVCHDIAKRMLNEGIEPSKKNWSIGVFLSRIFSLLIYLVLLCGFIYAGILYMVFFGGLAAGG